MTKIGLQERIDELEKKVAELEESVKYYEEDIMPAYNLAYRVREPDYELRSAVMGDASKPRLVTWVPPDGCATCAALTVGDG